MFISLLHIYSFSNLFEYVNNPIPILTIFHAFDCVFFSERLVKPTRVLAANKFQSIRKNKGIPLKSRRAKFERESKIEIGQRANMKVTELESGCVEKILKYLSYGDLLNVAESNLHLREVARVVYRFKYRATKLFIYGVKLSAVRSVTFTDTSDHRANVSDLKTSLILLRHFGSSIPTISVIQSDEELTADSSTSEFDDISYARLIAYINQYCCESLARLNFDGYLNLGSHFSNAMEQCERPFMNVRTIQLNNGSALNRNPVRLFPNIRNLQYCISNFDHYECVRLASMNCHFPKLEVLGIGFIRHKFFQLKMTDPKCSKLVPHVNAILHMNPQIKSLAIPFFLDKMFLENLSVHLPRLKGLHLARAPSNFAHFDGHFKRLKQFSTCYEDYIYENNIASNLMTIDGLEEFQCYILKKSDIEFFDFLARNPSINRLTLFSAHAFPKEITATYLAETLPNLKEINFRKCKFTISDPLSFIKLLKSLKEFAFRLAENSSYEYLVRSLPNGWQATKHHQDVSFGSEFVMLWTQN